MINATSGEAFMSKIEDKAFELLEKMAMNNYQWPSQSLVQRKAIGSSNDADTNTTLTA